MFFIGIIIAILILYLAGEGGFFILGVLLFAIVFSIYFRVRKINKDLLSIKLKLEIDDDETENYRQSLAERVSEQRQLSLLNKDDDEEAFVKTDADYEIEAELEQYSERPATSDDTGKKD